MKRPIFIATIAYINGIIIGIYLPQSIFLLLCLLMISIIINMIYLIKKNLKKYTITIIYLIIVLTVSLYTSWLDNNYENKYKQYDDQNVRIIGTIVSNVEEEEYKNVFTIKVEKLNNIKCNGDNLLVNLKKSKDTIEVKYGDKIILEGTYTEPTEARNCEGFDYKNYLKTEEIYGKITTQNIKIIKENNLNIVSISINLVLNKIEKNIKELLLEDTANLAIGILTGYDDEIDEKIIQSFKDSSLSHMLAVSGSHITYVIFTISLILRKEWIGVRKQKILTVIILIFFMILTGKTPSVSRAVISTIIYIIASLLYKKADTINSISISVLITLVQNPFNILNIGMQLSYAGTIGIILFYNTFIKRIAIKNKILKYVVDNILISISANVLIIPIMMYQFNTISLTFIFSNLLASPILGLIMILEILIVLTSFISIKLAIIPSFFLNILLKILIKIADSFSKISISKIMIPTPSLITIVIIYTIIISTLYIIKYCKNIKIKIVLKRSITAALVFVIVMELLLSINITKNLAIHFIDVGQGDSTLIITPSNKKILIDGGGSEFSTSFDVGEQILVPYLLDRKINKIDYLVISHFDSDHVGGLFTVMQKLKVENVIIGKQFEDSVNYQEFIKIVNKKKIKVYEAEAYEKISIEENLYFEILWPSSKDIVTENILNNNSLVFKLVYKKFSMLFTGDIEEVAEKRILNKYGNNLKLLNATVLKVAHHGSKTSSIKEFLDIADFKYAVIGVGEYNKFGHPNEGVLERLTDLRYKDLQNR